MRRISRDERRARLGVRHHLAQPGSELRRAVNSLVALHSSDPVTVYLSLWARVPGFEVDQLEDELYEKRSLIRQWGMRRTLWVVDRDLLPQLVAACSHLGTRERRRTAKLIEAGGLADDGEAWMKEHLPATLETIRRHGQVFTRQLTKENPALADRITFTNAGGAVTGSMGMGSRALVQLGMESKVVRTRPAGTWISGQYGWAAIEDWLGGPVDEIPIDDARASIIGQWLRSFGPGTELDLQWWTAWTVRQVRQGLADIGAVEVDLGEDGIGFVHSDDLDEVEDPGSWVALLPSLDSTTMGWKKREWYIGDNQARLFDRNGNAGSTVWVDGRAVGSWAQRRNGQIVYRLLEDVGAEAEAGVAARCEQLQRWLGEVTFTPRFRSPDEKALAS